MERSRHIGHTSGQSTHRLPGRSLPIWTAAVAPLNWDFSPNSAQHRVAVTAKFAPPFAFRRPFCCTAPDFWADHTCPTYHHALLNHITAGNPGELIIRAPDETRHDA